MLELNHEYKPPRILHSQENTLALEGLWYWQEGAISSGSVSRPYPEPTLGNGQMFGTVLGQPASTVQESPHFHLCLVNGLAL